MKSIFASLTIAAVCLLNSFEAKAANPRHVRQLLDTNVCLRCDLSFANLRGIDLRGADLRGSDFRGADLRGTDLRDADLRWTDLRGAQNFTDGFNGSVVDESTIFSRTFNRPGFSSADWNHYSLN